MAWRFALMIDPADPGAEVTDFVDTFTELDPAAPALTVGELSTQRGDGIFESIGVVDGHPQETQAHLERLAHSAGICDLPAPNLEQWRQAVAVAAAHGPQQGEAVIKLILSRGVEHGPGGHVALRGERVVAELLVLFQHRGDVVVARADVAAGEVRQGRCGHRRLPR